MSWLSDWNGEENTFLRKFYFFIPGIFPSLGSWWAMSRQTASAREPPTGEGSLPWTRWIFVGKLKEDSHDSWCIFKIFWQSSSHPDLPYEADVQQNNDPPARLWHCGNITKPSSLPWNNAKKNPNCLICTDISGYVLGALIFPENIFPKRKGRMALSPGRGS